MLLEGTLSADVGPEAVEFTYTVTNAGTEPADLNFRSAQTADVVVYDGGEAIWRWSEGRMFAQATQTMTLPPAESVRQTMRWDDPPSGSYTAVASLAASNTDLTTETDVRV
jgi:hypothetical protein